jgi:CubicO group peptidase (beta-lactamase class C family)
VAADAWDANLRLVDFETYVDQGTRYIAALWIENIENLGYDSLYNLTYDQAVTYYNAQRSTRMPVDVDEYTTGAGVRYALIWVDNRDRLGWRLHFGISDADFGTKFDSYSKEFRMLVVDSATDVKGQTYSGIWLQNTSGRSAPERRDLTSLGYDNWWSRYADEGYRLIGYERYDTAAGPRYVGVWRQNTNRPNWPLKATVDGLMQSELDTWSVPGVSVAIIHNGQFVYKRGFGYADVSGGVWLNSSHVLRTGSVAKAVAGVLTMRLVEEGTLPSANLPLSSFLDDVPDQHEDTTLEELVSNRGCVRHYNGSADDATLASTEYDTALDAAEVFWDDPLVASCTVGTTNKYSTFGYTLLGAALEEAAGKPIDQLVVDELTNPYGLGTLRPENLDDASVSRSKMYETDNDEATPDEVSWKVLGGGMESSVADLARFGQKLLAGQIISPLAREYMWTGTPWSDYAYGWMLESETAPDGDSHRLIGKNGAWSIASDAWLQTYPDDGVVIAVLSNRYGDHDNDGVPESNNSEVLGRAIGTAVLATLP